MAIDPTPAPWAHVPLFQAQKGNPETGLLPPLSYMLGPDLMPFFRRIPFLFPGEIPAEDTPPGDGTQAKKFQTDFLSGEKTERANPHNGRKKA